MEKLSIMVIPGNNKKTRTFHLSLSFAKSLTLLLALFVVIVLVLGFDYFKLLNNAYQSKRLRVENRQLKEQIQIFQMKMNTLTQDLERIHTFEKKLRILTGLDKQKLIKPFFDKIQEPNKDLDKQTSTNYEDIIKESFLKKLKFDKIESEPTYTKFKDFYKEKIFDKHGLNKNYKKQEWGFDILRETNELSKDFALFDYKYGQLKEINGELEENLNELDQLLLDRESLMRSTPILLPASGWITSFYGPRISPYSGRKRMHEGIDIGAPFGAPIVAPADGVVIFAGTKPGFGKHVQIDHGYGIETLYAHSQKVYVESGEKIKRGDLLAAVGSTGHSTGPHLHYEVRINGVAVDPYYFLLEY